MILLLDFDSSHLSRWTDGKRIVHFERGNTFLSFFYPNLFTVQWEIWHCCFSIDMLLHDFFHEFRYGARNPWANGFTFAFSSKSLCPLFETHLVYKIKGTTIFSCSVFCFLEILSFPLMLKLSLHFANRRFTFYIFCNCEFCVNIFIIFYFKMVRTFSAVKVKNYVWQYCIIFFIVQDFVKFDQVMSEGFSIWFTLSHFQKW